MGIDGACSGRHENSRRYYFTGNPSSRAGFSLLMRSRSRCDIPCAFSSAR